MYTIYIYIHLYCIYMDCIYIRCTHSGVEVERIYNWTISCLGVKLVDIPAFPGLYTDMIQASAQGECARIIFSPYRMLFFKEHASNPNLQCKSMFSYWTYLEVPIQLWGTPRSSNSTKAVPLWILNHQAIGDPPWNLCLLTAAANGKDAGRVEPGNQTSTIKIHQPEKLGWNWN